MWKSRHQHGNYYNPRLECLCWSSHPQTLCVCVCVRVTNLSSVCRPVAQPRHYHMDATQCRVGVQNHLIKRRVCAQVFIKLKLGLKRYDDHSLWYKMKRNYSAPETQADIVALKLTGLKRSMLGFATWLETFGWVLWIVVFHSLRFFGLAFRCCARCRRLSTSRNLRWLPRGVAAYHWNGFSVMIGSNSLLIFVFMIFFNDMKHRNPGGACNGVHWIPMDDPDSSPEVWNSTAPARNPGEPGRCVSGVEVAFSVEFSFLGKPRYMLQYVAILSRFQDWARYSVQMIMKWDHISGQGGQSSVERTHAVPCFFDIFARRTEAKTTTLSLRLVSLKFVPTARVFERWRRSLQTMERKMKMFHSFYIVWKQFFNALWILSYLFWQMICMC